MTIETPIWGRPQGFNSLDQNLVLLCFYCGFFMESWFWGLLPSLGTGHQEAFLWFNGDVTDCELTCSDENLPRFFLSL